MLNAILMLVSFVTFYHLQFPHNSRNTSNESINLRTAHKNEPFLADTDTDFTGIKNKKYIKNTKETFQFNIYS